jgi:DNA end-binding protein Ku
VPRKASAKAAAPAVDAEDAPRGRSFWSGTLTFGLVSIPVDLYAATRRGRQGLRLLSPGGNALRRRFFCSVEGVEVPPEQLVRGYEVTPGEYVVVEDEELAALAPRASRDIDLSRFVPLADIDPMLFDRPYLLAPGGSSTKAYRLLAAVMEETGRAGIATFVMRGKEYLVAILAEGGLLRAETLRFADEVRSVDEVGLPEPRKPAATTVKRYERLIAGKAAAELDPDELEDPWAQQLQALAERKRKRGEDVVETDDAASEEEAEVIDLMAVLKRSLAGGGGEGGRESRPRAAARPAQRRSPARSRATTATRRAGARKTAAGKSAAARRPRKR